MANLLGPDVRWLHGEMFAQTRGDMGWRWTSMNPDHYMRIKMHEQWSELCGCIQCDRSRRKQESVVSWLQTYVEDHAPS